MTERRLSRFRVGEHVILPDGEVTVKAVLEDADAVEDWFEIVPGWHEVEAPPEWATVATPTWLAARADPCGGNTKGGEGCSCDPPF